MEDMIYRPRDMYNNMFKRQFHDEAEALFEQLTKKSGVDTGENKVHVEAYKQAQAKADEAGKKAKKLKVWATLLLVFSILFIIAGLIITFAAGKVWSYIVGPILAVGGVSGLIIRFTLIKKKLKSNTDAHQLAQQEADKKQEICYEDMQCLNSLFDWNMPVLIMNKASKLLQLDPYFSSERLQFLVDCFGYKESENYLESVVQVTSGLINGNPFILEKVHGCEIRPKTYTGTLVITWTETYTDSDGHLRSEHHSETLVATIERDAPFYDLTTRIVYGNQAAPDLCFSRYPSGAKGKNEKQIASLVKSKTKELDRQEKKALKDASNNFTRMGNEEFDALFGANDRNNEVQFRLLFTPLAQTNEMDLIKTQEPYGDDFVMVKDKMITSVASKHSQTFDYSARPSLFYGYDYEEVKKRFITYCDDYIRGLFFDLAPILSIPLFQNHQSTEFIYKDEYPQYFPSHEHEVMANGLGQSYFRPEDADASLPVMLKAIWGKKKGESDTVKILGTSYHTIPQVEYVPVHGGDGDIHMVPVEWIEYIETQKESYIGVSKVGSSLPEVSSKWGQMDKAFGQGGAHYERGLASCFLGEKQDNSFISTLSKLKE